MKPAEEKLDQAELFELIKNTPSLNRNMLSCWDFIKIVKSNLEKI